jgi:hypothetical protein
MKCNCGYATVTFGAILMNSWHESDKGGADFSPYDDHPGSVRFWVEHGQRPDALALSQSSPAAAIATSRFLLTSSEPWI